MTTGVIGLLALATPRLASGGNLLSHHYSPMLSPTLCAAFGYELGQAGSEQLVVSAGVAFYPELGPGFLAPRLGLLLDAAIHEAEVGSTYVTFTPTLHTGLALVFPSQRERDRFGRALVPLLHVYGIVGVRLPGRHDEIAERTAIRLGVGISSPILSLLTLATAKAGVAVPNLVEITADLEPATRHTSWLFKVGVGL